MNLLGADDILVNGTNYNVDFIPDTFNSLYATLPPTFDDVVDADMASTALLNQIFNESLGGDFQTLRLNPYLVNGAGGHDGSSGCCSWGEFWMFSPYLYNALEFDTSVLYLSANNGVADQRYVYHEIGIPRDLDMTTLLHSEFLMGR